VLVDILSRVLVRLNKAKSENKLNNFSLIGAMAVSRWGIPRATADFDFFISTNSLHSSGDDDKDLLALANSLGGVCEKGDVSDPLKGVITFNEYDSVGELPIQLIMFPKKWEEMLLSEIDIVNFEGLELPISSWRSLVLLKLYAGSSRDLEDAKGILEVQKISKKDAEWIKQKASTFRLSKSLSKIWTG
jgi:hypothetical protein